MIPGVSVVSDMSNMVPVVGVLSLPKDGKSATVGTTLVDWPKQGMHPLFIAFDETGPYSCLKLGYEPRVADVKSRTDGQTTYQKVMMLLNVLEMNKAALRQQHGAIIVDCASTMVEAFYADAVRFSKNSNPQSHFGDALKGAKEVYNRVKSLGLPVVWLAWLKPSEKHEEPGPNGQKRVVVTPGGPNILGSFRDVFAGLVEHMFILEKRNVGPGGAVTLEGVGAIQADSDGFARLFHARSWNGIAAGGRYGHVLPAQCPAHMGWIMSQMKPNKGA